MSIDLQGSINKAKRSRTFGPNGKKKRRRKSVKTNDGAEAIDSPVNMSPQIFEMSDFSSPNYGPEAIRANSTIKSPKKVSFH